MALQNNANWLGVSKEEMQQRIDHDAHCIQEEPIDPKAQKRHNACFMMIISILIAARMKQSAGGM